MRKNLKSAICILFALCFMRAAPAAAETIGVLLSSEVPYYRQMHDALTAKLSKEGYDDRLKFIVQRPHSNPLSWSNAARKLIAAEVDIIVTYGYGPTAAVLREKPDKPIVYVGSHLPISGKKANITGMYIKLPISSVLRYLRATAPIDRLAVLYCRTEDDSVQQLSEIKAMASKYGFTVAELDVTSSADIAARIAGHGGADAFFLTSSAAVNSVYGTILSYARNKKTPTGAMMTFGESSALVTLSSDPEEQGEGAAEKLIEILRGKRAGNIQPSAGTNIELIFNMKEAREIGIKIPMELVTEATRIIH